MPPVPRVITNVDATRTAEFPSAAGSVPAARHLIRDDLHGRGVPSPTIEDVLLVVSELVGNAVQHGQPRPAAGVTDRIRLRWRVVDKQVVLIHVTHAGSASWPRVRSASPSQTAGRGLAIVDLVASDWGVSADRSEITVHAIIGGPAGHTRPERRRAPRRPLG